MKILNTKKIINHEVLGNKTLYDLCKKHIKNSIPEFVSAKVWLIGRAYAVSPQRRKIPNKEPSKKYNFFFESFAELFTKDKEKCFQIDKYIKELNKSKITGIFQTDKELISKVLTLISLFNKHMVETIKQIDNYKDGDKAPNKSISFTSKYLHFHCPKIVYIFDSFSNANARSFIKQYKEQYQIDEKISELKSKINDEDINDYIAHYIRCYFISNNFFNTPVTPRQLDNALLSELIK